MANERDSRARKAPDVKKPKMGAEEEECHTAVPDEDCFWATKWLMDEGRIKHPDAYPEVTAESTWEDAQRALWKSGKNECKKPCKEEPEEISGKAGTAKKAEGKEEECHTSVPHEDCYHATKWLMDEGRIKHPDAYPDVTAESSWEDAQHALWKRGKSGCKKPCNHESETETEEVDQEECHNAVPHEDCYYGTKWLMEEGIQKNPEWFPEITPDSPWADAQKALWKRGKNGCMKPCPVTK
ncbi:unnamed protein product [Symbiodinium natans]|uniref:Uncharacterized protein n=1 Tax=Symbiodinium natans TaxID=878477 RepID=A0A812ILR2_9DINO|nr:unnamed protein product [Symbiodinium natans]